MKKTSSDAAGEVAPGGTSRAARHKQTARQDFEQALQLRSNVEGAYEGRKLLRSLRLAPHPAHKTTKGPDRSGPFFVSR